METSASPIEPGAAIHSGTKDERMWAMIAHLSAFAMYCTAVGHIVGPLIIWLAKRDGHPFIDDQGKEVLNFQISWTLYMIANVLLLLTVVGAVVAIPLFFVLPVFHVICMIIGGIKANDGIAFRYPLCIRFIS